MHRHIRSASLLGFEKSSISGQPFDRLDDRLGECLSLMHGFGAVEQQDGFLSAALRRGMSVQLPCEPA
ncbi:hypothetical protein X729_31700 [Mesorhizobium sp. L103C131B0]|nr:hypothetical protein X729_31700 [Mesorhizobium sp. L103C131B0]